MTRLLSGKATFAIAVIGLFYLFSVTSIKLWRGQSRISDLGKNITLVDHRLGIARQAQEQRRALLFTARQQQRLHPRATVEAVSQTLKSTLRESLQDHEFRLVALHQKPLPADGELQVIGFELSMTIKGVDAIALIRHIEESRPSLLFTRLQAKGPREGGPMDQITIEANAIALLER